MISYLGRHAEFYDLFYGSKPYAEEAKFVGECLVRHGLPCKGLRLLELACGTGTHALHFAKLGCQVTATDSSPGMLAIARSKAEAGSVPVQFIEQDMRHLPAPLTFYDAAVCLFDSIGYVQTDQAVGEVLSGVQASVRPGGLFIFEFWHAPAMLSGFDPIRVRRFATKGGTVLRISETTLHPEEHLASVAYDIYDLRDDRTYDHVAEVQTNRYFTVGAMETWAARHGFRPLAFHAGFDFDLPVTDATWHVVAVWRRL